MAVPRPKEPEVLLDENPSKITVPDIEKQCIVGNPKTRSWDQGEGMTVYEHSGNRAESVGGVEA